ncbi:hypothetical protein FOZ60_009962 [Perkinsus olseni]|uniref:Uncharacterized protein n=1 Tax=Perkinsus olseni TaxID=32597 RepID=A0A7J6PC94_PEROL|nr:hypothetical protein FOZ60_009962 [Perkinsus olseni]
MLRGVLVVGLSFIPLCQCLDEDTVNLAFVGFQRKHGKRYKDEAERRKRADIFRNNLDHIEKVNSQNLTYKLGVNQYSDLTFEEFSAQMLLPNAVTWSPPEPSHVRVEVEDSGGVGCPPFGGLEESKGVLNPIKDQKTCACCWAFSAIGTDRLNAILNKKLMSFSEQQLNDCNTGFGNRGCAGGNFDYAFLYVNKSGITQESTYPYKSRDDKCDAALEAKADGLPIGEVTDYARLVGDDGLVNAVAKAPVSVALYVNQNFRHYKSGVFSDPSCHGLMTNHAAVVVGYGKQGKDE